MHHPRPSVVVVGAVGVLLAVLGLSRVDAQGHFEQQRALKRVAELGSQPEVFKLAPSPRMEKLMALLLEDPLAMFGEGSGASLVLIAQRLPPGERLIRVKLELWDSFALERRKKATRVVLWFGERFALRETGLHHILFPDESEARRIKKHYRLSRVLKLKQGSPWLGNLNGHGVIVFPLASHSISSASLILRTESWITKPGKRAKRTVTNRSHSSIPLPGPEQPANSPEDILESLGVEPL